MVKRSFHSLIFTSGGRYLAIYARIERSIISEGSLVIGSNSGMHREIVLLKARLGEEESFGGLAFDYFELYFEF